MGEPSPRHEKALGLDQIQQVAQVVHTMNTVSRTTGVEGEIGVIGDGVLWALVYYEPEFDTWLADFTRAGETVL